MWPLETHFATKIEIFNECSMIGLTYGMLMFTDFVPDPEMRFKLGWYYIVINLGNISVHLLVLVGGSGKQIKN